MDGTKAMGWMLVIAAWLCAPEARAHITLLEPASWLEAGPFGEPQKGSPCGPGDSRPSIGDDIQPIPVSSIVTSYRAGETITVKWLETVYHPGYFRIALARTSAAEATTADLPDPPLTDPVACYYDRSAVPTAPHGDVLADGLFMAEEISAEGRMLMHEVTLPDEPCERCTLQVVQVMENHGGESCFYFHCADIEILPAQGGASGMGAAGEGQSAAGAGGAPPIGTAGMGAAGGAPSGSAAMGAAGGAGAQPAASDGGGCAVATGGVSSVAAWALAAAGLGLRRRRMRASRANGCE